MSRNDSLNIADVHLDEANPRLGLAKNQKEAIKLMFDEQTSKLYNKLYKLACDIAKRGLNPSKKFIVFRENNKYVIGDGNRRLTVLKVLETPDLIENKEILSKFKKLSAQFMLQNLTKIDCEIFDKREDAKHWIEVNHTGEQEGRGQIAWNTVQKQRFLGEKSIGARAIEVLRAHGKILEQENLNVRSTNLDRLLGYRIAKDYLSIDSSQGDTKFNDIEKLEKVVRALNKETVSKVYSSKSTKEFLQKILGDSKSIKPIKSTQQTKQKTKRSSDKAKHVIFGEALSLKPSIVKNIYDDIVAIYSLYHKKQNGFAEILGFSLRFLLDVAASEYYKSNPAQNILKKDQYKTFVKLLKKEAASSSDQSSMAIDPFIKNITEEVNVEALLAKLAHGDIPAHIDLVLILSKIIGPILKKYFSVESASDVS